MGCSCTSKLVLSVLSVLFWLVSIALILVGVWIYVGYRHVENLADSHYVLIPATIIIAAGVFVFLLGIIGCIGAFKEQKCLLGVYFTILLIIFVTLIAGGILAWLRMDDVKDAVHDGLHEGLDKYGFPNETQWTDDIDYVQEHLKCCGVTNYTDWTGTPWNVEHKLPYPESCCEDKNCTYHDKNSTRVYTDGCYVELRDEVKSHLGIIAAVAAVFVVIQLLGMICSCVLICRRKTEVPYIGLNDPQGMRV